jgi:hypothetical protein
MAANGSSMNSEMRSRIHLAQLCPMNVNERLAAVLIQNMNQLNDLAKQGKLNQQQIMQVRS